jgi:hypothetical protein
MGPFVFPGVASRNRRDTTVSKQNPTPEVYRLNNAATHPLAIKYGISTRQFQRAVQSGRIAYAKPGGLRVLFTSEDIEEFILGSRSDATKA